DVHARAGDVYAMQKELVSLLEVHPMHWEGRLQLLNLDHATRGDLAHATAVLRDLIWERGYSAACFNAGRPGAIPNVTQLGHDEAVLSHMGLCDGDGYGVVDLNRCSVGSRGALALLNPAEPWLEVFDPSGQLRFGLDLWFDDADPIERPIDVAISTDGAVYLADSLLPRLLRISLEGGSPEAEVRLVGKGALPLGLAALPGGRIAVLQSDGGGCVRVYDAAGRAVGDKRGLEGLKGSRLCLGIAADDHGEVCVTNGKQVAWMGRAGVAPRTVALSGSRGRLVRGARFNAAWDASRQELLVVLPGLDAVGCYGRDGARRGLLKQAPRLAEKGPGLAMRACPAFSLEQTGGLSLSAPHDLAVTPAGVILVCDTGHARVVAVDHDHGWNLIYGFPGWRGP
ncbi:MAG: NHL repeat-containing protein, partial [Planctomycetota bacterium]